MKIFLKSIIYTTIAAMAVMNYSCNNDNGGDPNNPQPYEFQYGGHRYKIVKDPKNWIDAAKDAVSQGGYLVEIGSQDEQDAVYKGIIAAGVPSNYTKVQDGGGVAYVWIGATDMAQEGIWLWNGANKTSGLLPVFWMGNNTGVAVGGSYVNWGGKSKGSFNEPDNLTDPDVSPNGQNAAAIGLASWPAGSSSPLGIAGEWNDIAETNKLFYVIEFGEEETPQPQSTIYDTAKVTYGGDLFGVGTAAFILDMYNASDDNVGMTIFAFNALPANFGSFSPEGTYTIAETGAANTFFPGNVDDSGPWATFAYNYNTNKFTLIKGGTLNISRSGNTYTVTTDFTGVDSETNAAVNDLRFSFTGTIDFTDASAGTTSGDLSFSDISAGTYTATGTPSFLSNPGAETWKGTITPQSDGEYTYYTLSNWGNDSINVYLDFINGKIFIDNYSRIVHSDTYNGYFFAVEKTSSTYKLISDDYEVKYNKTTKILDFSGTYNGDPVVVGVVAINNSTNNFESVFTDLYADVKLQLSLTKSLAPQYSQIVAAKTTAPSVRFTHLMRSLQNSTNERYEMKNKFLIDRKKVQHNF